VRKSANNARSAAPTHLVHSAISECLTHVWVPPSNHNQRSLGVFEDRIAIVFALQPQRDKAAIHSQPGQQWLVFPYEKCSSNCLKKSTAAKTTTHQAKHECMQAGLDAGLPMFPPMALMPHDSQHLQCSSAMAWAELFCLSSSSPPTPRRMQTPCGSAGMDAIAMTTCCSSYCQVQHKTHGRRLSWCHDSLELGCKVHEMVQ
jgi:hypothetical protein